MNGGAGAEWFAWNHAIFAKRGNAWAWSFNTTRSSTDPERVSRIKAEEEPMQRRALVVDDEAAVCQLIQEVMSSAGMKALTLTRSTDAADYLRDEKFEVVLLDLRMPGPAGTGGRGQTGRSGVKQKERV